MDYAGQKVTMASGGRFPVGVAAGKMATTCKVTNQVKKTKQGAVFVLINPLSSQISWLPFSPRRILARCIPRMRHPFNIPQCTITVRTW